MSNPKLKLIATITADRQLSVARFSPDGAILATAGYEPLVRRWRLSGEKDFQPLPSLEGFHGWTTGVVFHPHKPWLIAADSWGQLRCQASTEDQSAPLWRHEKAHDGWLRQVAISPDGRHVATCGRDRFLRIWNAETGALVSEHQAAEDLYTVAFHPAGQLLLFGDLRGRVEAWDLAAKKSVRTFDAAAFYKLDRLQDIGGLRVLRFLDEGKTLLTAGTTPLHGATIESVPTMLTFDFESGKLRETLKYGKPKDGFIHDVAPHPEGYLVVVTSGSPGSGQVLLARPGEPEPFLTETKLANCHAVTLHPDGKHFLVTSTNRDSAGNGRKLGKEGDYFNNSSPLTWYELVA